MALPVSRTSLAGGAGSESGSTGAATRRSSQAPASTLRRLEPAANSARGRTGGAAAHRRMRGRGRGHLDGRGPARRLQPGAGAAAEAGQSFAAELHPSRPRDRNRRDQLRQLRDRLGHRPSTEDDLVVRLSGSPGCLRRHAVSPDRAGVRDSGRRSHRQRHRRPRLLRG
jgi:hypothetical protein